jgi:hypothetical protein
MKTRVPALKLKRETIRELSNGELSQAAGGNVIPQSELPTCLCSSIPCGGPTTIAIG